MSDLKEKDTQWNTFLNRLIWPLFTFMVGVIIPTIALIQPVREKQIDQSSRLEHIQEDIKEMHNAVIAVMAQNTEVIGLFKLQQQMGTK